MHHGCYKLCPKVREQQRKAREAREKSKVTDASSGESIEGSAGPSGLQKSSRAGERKKYEDIRKPVYSSESYESLRSRDREGRKRNYPRRSYESVRKQDVGSSTREYSRKYVNKVESHTRDKRRKEETRTSGPASPEASRITSERKMAKMNGRNALKPETSRKKYEAGASRSGDRRKDERSKKDEETRGNCERDCPGLDEKATKNGTEEEQEAFDEYIINKSICYFQDLCNCHYGCLLDQLWRDSFFRSTIASTVVFAIGVKLCFEMDGWRIPF